MTRGGSSFVSTVAASVVASLVTLLVCELARRVRPRPVDTLPPGQGVA